jgi:hypothetical protein
MSALQIWLHNHNRRLSQEAIDEALMEYIALVEKQRDSLLAALSALIDMDVSYQRGPVVERAVETARSAIASVKGESKPIDQCAECKSMSPVTTSMCKKCEDATPAFTEAAINFLKGSAK